MSAKAERSRSLRRSVAVLCMGLWTSLWVTERLLGRGDLDRPDVAVLIFDTDTVVAEVMDTPDERSDGLQFREALPDGTGMLFVFPSEAQRSFWMKDTYLALDIAFMDAGFRIVDIQQMEPQTEELHVSSAPAMFALEVRKGWFSERGIQVGRRADVAFDPPGVRIR